MPVLKISGITSTFKSSFCFQVDTDVDIVYDPHFCHLYVDVLHVYPVQDHLCASSIPCPTGSITGVGSYNRQNVSTKTQNGITTLVCHMLSVYKCESDICIDSIQYR